MVLPPDLISIGISATSSGTANTNTTGTILAAPGAALRYRVWGFIATPNNTAQALANWRAGLTEGAGGTSVIQASGANFASSMPAWVPGGRTLATNTAIGYLLQSALINAGFTLIAWYTLETA